MSGRLGDLCLVRECKQINWRSCVVWLSLLAKMLEGELVWERA